jgi:biotin transporter BioY
MPAIHLTAAQVLIGLIVMFLLGWLAFCTVIMIASRPGRARKAAQAAVATQNHTDLSQAQVAVAAIVPPED